ncbi:hypothetical protein [Desulfofalx alkaliphila]|uniref:hypothetical protein n=1 Tax=Desulfofalx alkaliphila TaxID=105483 RepID=UPI0004E19084|nr:hypothetical protein [Desulfofalx alkaliphila]
MKKYTNLILLLFMAFLISMVMAGCSLPFINNDDGQSDQESEEATQQSQSQGVEAQRDDAEQSEKKDEPEPAPEPAVSKDNEEQPAAGPGLTVNLPEQMTTNHSELEISGTADSQCTVYVNGRSIRLRNDGTFSTDVELKVGNNTIQVIAVDNKGNSTRVERQVNFAAERPSLQVFAPSESTSTTVTLSGYTDPGSVVYIDNNKIKADANGGFSGTVQLKNKGNNTVRVVAVNNYGLSTTVNTVIKGIPPRIEVAAPDLVTTDRVTITGVVDAGSTVVVLAGTKKVTVNSGDGTFSETIDLEPGINDILVMAANFFGKTEVSLPILYDDYIW